MNKRLNRVYELFLVNLQDKSISDYFNVSANYELIRESVMEFKFSVDRCSFPKAVFTHIPIELSMRISSFLFNHDSVSYSLCFPNDYPFNPPKWELLSYHSSTQVNYAYHSHEINMEYARGWTPMITIEKNILNMIELIEKSLA